MLPRLLCLALVFLALVSSASAFAAPNDTIESLYEMKEMKTVIEWSRQLRTCDEAADRDIPLTGTSRIIYAIGDNDPKDDRSVAMHSSMGVRNVNLMDSAAVPSEPSDTYNITLQSRPFPISPDSDQKPGTYYHCQGFAANFTQKAHIIRVTPRINYAHSALVHHMLLFKCPTPFSQKDLDWAGNCYSSDTPKPVSACDQISVIAGWAVGGDEFVYPQDVGFPMGEEAGTTFMMLQIHYHNPNHLTFNDSAGFALHMTHQLRQHDAGSFFMQEELSSIRIPAKQSAYEIGVYCPDNCMKFPAAGVNVFASMLHTHETGVAVWTEHFRNGTQLPYIDENRGYDFNYQQVVTFSPDAYPVLKAGDSLKLTCRYNTMQRTGVTTGGIATTDEMCMDYLWYYPAFALDACTGISKATTPGKFTASCNYGKQRTNVLNFTPPNVTVPLPTYPCTAATQGNRTYNGDGTTGTTAISTEQWLADKASFTRSMVLDDQGDFVLYWNVSMDADGHNGVVRFAAEVATSGWFGLGFSASGAMIDADTVIGWVHTEAEGGQHTTVDMTDRYNDKYGRPPIDVSQDIFDVVGVQDMLPVIIPKPNGIYYNFSAGGAPGCHHCVPYDESSSSSSTGSVVVLPSSSSSSSIVRGASSSSSVRVVPSSSSASPSSSRRASSSSSAAMPTSAPQPSSTASMPPSSSIAATSANTDMSSSADSAASTGDASSGGSDVSSSSGEGSSSGTSGTSNTTDSSSGADGSSMSSSSLSAGAIAGIVIGSVLGALLMIGLLMFVLITTKNHSSSSREDVNLIGMTDDSLSNSADRRRNRRNDMRHGLLAGENSTLV